MDISDDPNTTTPPHSECPICFNPYSSPCQTTCGHVFCAECLTRSFPPETPSSGACPLCRAPVSLYSTVDRTSMQPLRMPDVTSPFGASYWQHGEPGVAAYHFESLDAGCFDAIDGRCFISYENAPPDWKLSDGSTVPARKPFVGASYDAPSRTFRGTIDWSPHTLGGDARWEYTMIFSDDFNLIAGGQLQGYAPDGQPTREQRFASANGLVYWRGVPAPSSIVGCTFVQGGRLGLASYHFESLDADAVGGCYISYAAAPDSWNLGDGTRPPTRKPFENASYDEAARTFRGSIDWSPTTFGGDQRWEYEMVFSEDFAAITGGTVTSYDPSGAQTNQVRFSQSMLRSLIGPTLLYRRCDEIRMQMLNLLRSRGGGP